MRALAGIAALIFLAGCGDAGDSASAPFVTYEGEADMAFADMAEPAAQRTSAPSEQRAPQGGQMLAYAYDASLLLPSEAVPGVLSAHRDACQAAGTAVCQVLGASLYGQNEDARSGTLNFRAAPAYMATFRAGLTGDAEAAGGRLTAEQQRVEDLTRQITDMAARLEAQETLRDRLIDLLDRTDGEVGELLQVERELARVQGEIESMMSQLTYLRGRVSMNLMTVSYQSIPQAFTPAKRQPLLDAVRDFFGILAESIAGLVRFVALVLPWVIIGLPIAWFALRRFRRRRA